ncbi:MAG TPA: phosphate ABC transporter substrate-binding protein PstS family protein [Chlorobaculum sp.]|uniref:Phosphate-binding protein n=1 Tax=Chlorobaculum tepidum (strain ATCC 49652 / DSM 12025 / NBRC 103806 / TLS) TaxID=194439 RepID=Q8KDZ8_CHLTE|nr:phosphate ABC transporter, periplasmic phosphate-binding protein, putative [Chlorobaculum tepidum TLS]HBU23142.1 phosphate ABC transporter substrate-binding protein PstS family protein [Chlorobaculum sp.]
MIRHRGRFTLLFYSLRGNTPLLAARFFLFIKKYGVTVSVSESGSGNGAKSLINGECDIADMSRPMKPMEIEAARRKGVNPVQHIIALDGIAVVVHPANPTRALTKAQLASIYLGRVTNWKQVGGPNARIVVIQRESNSGTQSSFEEMALGKGMRVVRTAETAASNGAVKSRVASTPNAIGFVGLGYVDRSVKPLKIDGVLPNVAAVKSRAYPLARPLFMYSKGAATGMVARFLALPSTPDGRKIISELGFVNK